MFEILVALAGQPIVPNELRDVRKVAAVCRSAADAAERSGDAMDAIKFVDASAEAGGLSREQRYLLMTMCGVYSAGVTDTATKELNRTLGELDQNTEELQQLAKP